MVIGDPSRFAASSIVRFPPRLGGKLLELLFLLVAALFLFVDPIVPPVALADESRNANNAIDMHLGGFSLITTYDFRPDLWNTKPPLLIWLMSATMALFGPSEWALRLPSALAAMGTLWMVLLLVRRVTGSTGTALLAASLLLLSPGFFGEHGARTGDYDALLTLFVTAALVLLFFTLHRRRPRVRSLMIIGSLVGLAAMTKSVAAFIPLVGVFPYAIALRRWPRMFISWPSYALAVALGIGPLLLFVLLRESMAPGYVDAILFNDITGRFANALVSEETGPLYYVEDLLKGWFFAGPFLLAFPLVFRHLSGRSRLLAIYSAAISLTTLSIYSAAATRAIQYALPVMPWLAIAAALTLRHLVTGYVRAPWQAGRRAQASLIALGLSLVTAQLTSRAVYWRTEGFPARQFYPQASYGDVFAMLAGRGVLDFVVVEPGYTHLGVPGYAPLFRWNRLVWMERGLRIDRALTIATHPGRVQASCVPDVIRQWHGQPLEFVSGCAIRWPAQLAAPRS